MNTWSKPMPPCETCAPALAVDQAFLDDLARVARSASRSSSLAVPPSWARPASCCRAWCCRRCRVDVTQHVTPRARAVSNRRSAASIFGQFSLPEALTCEIWTADAALLADADGLVDGVEQHRGLAADVREVVAAARAMVLASAISSSVSEYALGARRGPVEKPKAPASERLAEQPLHALEIVGERGRASKPMAAMRSAPWPTKCATLTDGFTARSASRYCANVSQRRSSEAPMPPAQPG
jgi:hypothetical protein